MLGLGLARNSLAQIKTLSVNLRTEQENQQTAPDLKYLAKDTRVVQNPT